MSFSLNIYTGPVITINTNTPEEIDISDIIDNDFYFITSIDLGSNASTVTYYMYINKLAHPGKVICHSIESSGPFFAPMQQDNMLLDKYTKELNRIGGILSARLSIVSINISVGTMAWYH